jgi:hypothetical protein
LNEDEAFNDLEKFNKQKLNKEKGNTEWHAEDTIQRQWKFQRRLNV